MTILKKETERKRAQFTQEIIDSIRNVPRYCSFYSHTFNKIAALGLQMKAKSERLFDDEDWSNPTNKDKLMKKIEKFIVKHTR